jgi:hypothetical protein
MIGGWDCSEASHQFRDGQSCAQGTKSPDTLRVKACLPVLFIDARRLQVKQSLAREGVAKQALCRLQIFDRLTQILRGKHIVTKHVINRERFS